jgi:hypothetical protein
LVYELYVTALSLSLSLSYWSDELMNTYFQGFSGGISPDSKGVCFFKIL